MRLKRLFQLVIPVILTGLTACDNVTWGGVDLRLRTPASAAGNGDAAGDTLAPPEPEETPTPRGPLLGLVSVEDEGARLLPVGVLAAGGLAPLPGDDRPAELERLRRERLAGERRFILYAGGRRVGTFFPDTDGSVDRTFCNPRPTASGRVEVLPEASGVSRFLALPEESGARHPHTEYAPVTSTRAQRVAALQMAGSLYPRLQARWPPSVLEARADLRVAQPGDEGTLLAATFLYGDRLEVAEAPGTAYSLFFLAAEDDGRFSPVYVRYRTVGESGKQAPRFVDHADWDGDGRDEVLLEVFGSEDRWFVALDPAGPGWEESFREPCASAPGGPASVARGAVGPATPVSGPAPPRR